MTASEAGCPAKRVVVALTISVRHLQLNDPSVGPLRGRTSAVGLSAPAKCCGCLAARLRSAGSRKAASAVQRLANGEGRTCPEGSSSGPSAVIAAAMMVIVNAAGCLYNSTALLADGCPMGSHQVAIGSSASLYLYAQPARMPRRRDRAARFETNVLPYG